MMRFRASRTSLSPAPVVFLLTVPRRFLCCSSLFVRRWFILQGDVCASVVVILLLVALWFILQGDVCASVGLVLLFVALWFILQGDVCALVF